MDYAKPIDIGCQPRPSGAGEILIQCDGEAFLTFFAMSAVLSPEGYYEDLGRAVVHIKGLEQSKFGYPNDDAFRGHPLFNHGLNDGCGVFEVFGGSWERELIAQNKIPFPDTKGDLNCRHFIFPFKENVVECLARNMEVTCTRDGVRSILLQAVDEILRD